MPQELTIQLAMPLERVGVLGDEQTPPDPSAVAEEKLSRMKEDYERQLQALRQQTADQHTALDHSLQALRGAAGELDSMKTQMLDEMQQKTAELAIDIARKVLAQAVDEKLYRIDPIITQAVAQIPRRSEIVVRLCPDDLSRCERAGQGQGDQQGRISFVADPGVPPAGCVVESAEGGVESSVESSLEQVDQAMKDTE